MGKEYHGGSASIARPEYWWYRARADLLRAVLEDHVGEPARVLDVGSADGPSVAWLRTYGKQIALDLDPRGLGPGGVCGSAEELPFRDESFDVVAAFDVIEHCKDEHAALSEVARVLAPGGRFLMSVPAYQWAWSDFDEQNGHHRRYTRPRAMAAVEGAGLTVQRATYAFSAVFPFFAAERLARRVGRLASPSRRAAPAEAPADVVELPEVSPAVEGLLMRLSSWDVRLLRKGDLPFGSSVVVAASKTAP
jgi:SAM-dependent methyltransferase